MVDLWRFVLFGLVAVFVFMLFIQVSVGDVPIECVEGSMVREVYGDHTRCALESGR